MGYSPLGNPYATSCTKCGLACEAVIISGESDCDLLNGTRTLPRVTGTPPCAPSLTPRFGVVFGRTVQITCPDETDGTLGEIIYCVEEGGEAKYAHEVCCSCGGGSTASDLNGTIVGYRCGVAEFSTNLSGDISPCCPGEEPPIETECCPEGVSRNLDVEIAAWADGGAFQPGCDACLGSDSYPPPISGTTIPISYDDGLGYWVGSTTVCGATLEVRVECRDLGGGIYDYYIIFYVNGSMITDASLSSGCTFSCSPFNGCTSGVSFFYSLSDCQSIIAVVTEAS